MSNDPLNSFEQKIQNTGSDVKDRVTDFASKVKDSAGQMAETVSGKLAQPRETAADGLHRAASSLHDNAGSIPGGPKAVNLTHNVADGLESTASYLRDHDLGKMGKDVMDICRRYPTQSLVAALAVGFLIGRSRRS